MSGAAEEIANFVRRVLAASRKPRPVLFALNGPQGCGKTTATLAAAETLRRENGLIGVTVSMDDFYLPHGEQLVLAARFANNPYLQQRGYPGTHDISLALRILGGLKKMNETQNFVAVPRYDKSAFAGEGDRLPESGWPVIHPPVDFILFEGWMLGFSPVEDAQIADPNLKEVNTLLKPYEQWHRLFDAFIQMRSKNIRDVVGWRIEAEEKMRLAGKPAMSNERIGSYIEKFLPAYAMYLPGLEQNPPVSSPRLLLSIAANRHVQDVRQF